MASKSQPPQSSPQKSAGGKSQLRSKWSSNGPSPENFMTISGNFECNTYRVTVLCWLKKEKRRWTILSFDRFKLATLEQFIYTSTVTVEWAAYMSCSKCLWTLAFAARQNYRHVNANTLIGAVILFSGHPYIWARYCEPIIIIYTQMLWLC